MAKTMNGEVLIEFRPKKSRQGNGKHTKYAATSRNGAKKRKRGQGQIMPALICNLPSYEVWVRKEYLTDPTSGHGVYVKGVWVSAKSIPGRAF